MERELDQINVVPLVDVMLVLLVIVLTTATFITTGHIPIELAKAGQAADRQDEPIVITLAADGSLSLNGQPVPDRDLSLALSQHPQNAPVLVRAERGTILARFVRVVDEVRGLGFKQVGLEVAST